VLVPISTHPTAQRPQLDPTPPPPQGPGWNRQRNSWKQIVDKYGIDSSRYVEFSYLLYLDLDNVWIDDYVQFHLYGKVPRFVNRISSCVQF
jgi:hypothetical protein